MQVEHKSFYADLFTKRPAPGRDLVPVDPPTARPAAASPVKARPQAASPPAASPAAANPPKARPAAAPAAPVAPAAPAAPETPPARPPAVNLSPSLEAAPAAPSSPAQLPATLPALLPAPPLPALASAVEGLVESSPAGTLDDADADVDGLRLSPRQMANLSFDLYAAGAISFEDYALLAFQPELHPDFNRTIGALTGETAEPDRPRDFVRIWEERAEFQRRHDTSRKDLIEQSERIATVLRQIETPMNMVV